MYIPPPRGGEKQAGKCSGPALSALYDGLDEARLSACGMTRGDLADSLRLLNDERMVKP